MNRKTYRAAFDQVKFREDFQRETVDLLLTRAGQRQEKENATMNKKQIKRMPLIAAAIAAVLIVSAAAATLLLHPADVARQVGNDALAAAFESPDATVIDQSVESGDYRFTFAGLVSGAGLSELTEEADARHTYAVVTVQRVDGQLMTFDEANITATPLVSGYLPWSVNAWTLNGGYTAFALDGVLYYLYEYDSLEMFAGRTVYMAVYEGMSPSADMFNIAADETISYKDGVSEPHALFTIPLDAAKADPAAVAEFEASMRQDGFILTPAELEAALAAEGDAQPSAIVEPEDNSSFVVTEG